MRSLVLSGGGQLGAFQVGILNHLMGDLGYSYQSYFGISVGALNSGYLAMFTPDQHKQAAAGLEQLWLNIDTKGVYKRWFPFGKLHGLWKKSLFDSSPLRALVERELDRSKIIKSGNLLQVGAVSLATGEYKLFDQNYSQLHDAILGSSAFPGMLHPTKMEGQWWVDGGVRDVAPIGASIDAGADEIDVILTSPDEMDRALGEPKNILDVALKSVSIQSDEIMDDDLKIALLINELVKAGARPDKKHIKINIYRPERNLSQNLLEFDPKEIRDMISHGYEVAVKANK